MNKPRPMDFGREVVVSLRALRAATVAGDTRRVTIRKVRARRTK